MSFITSIQRHIITPRKPLSQKNPYLTHHLQSSLSTHILTSGDTTFSRATVVGKLYYVCTIDQSTAWSDSLPVDLLVERDVIQTLFSFYLEFLELFPRQTFGVSLRFLLSIYHNILKNISSIKNNFSRGSFSYVSILTLLLFLVLLSIVNIIPLWSIIT